MTVPGDNRTRARWYEISMNFWPERSSPRLKNWGEVDPGVGIHTYFPSIGVDQNDNAAITFARSSSDEYISMWRVLRTIRDEDFGESVLVMASTTPVSVSRWGDYSGTKPDPAQENTLWGHHEFATQSNTWRTWVARYDLPAGPQLRVDPLSVGNIGHAEVSGLLPFSTVYLIRSITGKDETPVPALSIKLDLANPVLVNSTTADAMGVAIFAATVPQAAANRPVWIQAAAQGTKSNVVLDRVDP